MLFYVRYYPKQTRSFSYVMIIATTFAVCLAYRRYRYTTLTYQRLQFPLSFVYEDMKLASLCKGEYRYTRLVQFLVIACMYVLRLFFVCVCFFCCCFFVVVLFCLFCFLVVFVFFRVVFFLLQMIAIIFDDAIFCILFQCYCVQVPY